MANEQIKEATPMIEVRNINKAFPGVQALDNVSVKFLPGEVHAVVGENGAGKSTLMKIMAGAYKPDSGEIFFQGEEVQMNHPVQAQNLGVAIIYQEFNLLPERTVAQNIYLGREPSKFGVINPPQLNKQTEDVLKELGVAKMINPTALVSTLSVAEQQLVEIAKAVSLNAKVLIMDEPTASLTSTEVNLLFDLVATLKARGLAVIFISHRLSEVFGIADMITVLKDGQLVGTKKILAMSPPKMLFI